MLQKLKDIIKRKPAAKRSGKWPRVRKEHLATNPTCAACGRGKKLEVHHIVPVHVDPSRELDPTNLMTLCEKGPGMNCHLFVGHLGNYKLENTSVRENAEYVKRRVNSERSGA